MSDKAIACLVGALSGALMGCLGGMLIEWLITRGI